MIVYVILLLASLLSIAVNGELSLAEPRFKSSCGSLPQAELCEDDCSTIYAACVDTCTDEGIESHLTFNLVLI